MRKSRYDSDQTDASHSDERDAVLLRRIAERQDRAALTELYSHYFHPLQRFVYRITHDLDLAQEAINDTMLVVWRKADTFAGRSKVSTWIMGIAYRRGLKLAERANRWSYRFKGADWDDAVEPIAKSPEHTDAMIQEDLISQALKSLSPKHRAVVELTYMQGYSYEEIAKIVNCPVNTVKTRMFHARARLQEIVSTLGRDDLDP